MKRKAIIAAPLFSGDTTISNRHIDLWRQFLASNTGGAWRDQELIHLNNATKDDLISALQISSGAEFSLLIILGKASLRKRDLPWPEIEIEVEQSTIKDCDLIPDSPTCCVVIDGTYDNSGRKTVGLPSLSANKYTEKYSNLYNNAIQRAENGMVNVYGGFHNAPLNPPFYFSELIINSVLKWAASSSEILNLYEAINLAKSDAKVVESKYPQYNGGRRRHHLPFAVGSEC